MEKIEAIIFDLGSVCFDMDWDTINQEMIKKYNISILIRSSENEKAKQIFKDAQEGKKNMQDLFKELNKEKHDLKEVVNFYKETYKKNKKINPYMKNLIEKLKNKILLFCLTDTNELHFETHKEQGLIQYFDRAFASFQIGSTKSNKDTFRKVLEEIKISPKKIIFIDDNEKNIETAKSFGIHSILFKNFDQLLEKLKELEVL